MTDAGILYLSYDGMLEPLGESQVISYLLRLASSHRIVLLSFEKPRDLDDLPRREEMQRRLRNAGIRWVTLRYHKRPPVLSTAFDIVIGSVAALALATRHRLSIAHARGYVPSAMALTVKLLLGLRFLFDMRGFWPEEKVEAGHWRRGSLVYRVTKRLERRFFESADAIVSLTEAGVDVVRSSGYRLIAGPLVVCIPTCTDLRRFLPGPRNSDLAERLGLHAASLVAGCVGTMSNWYLREAMLRYLACLVRQFDGLNVLCVTGEDHAALRDDARAAGMIDERLHLTRAEFAAMPDHIRLMDFGVFFIKPTFSKKGSAATKLGEFLACGVPVVINDGVGDSGAIVRRGRVGVVIDQLDADGFKTSIHEVRAMLRDREIRERCRHTASEVFDLERGVARYRDVYGALFNRRSRTAEVTAS